MKMVAVLTALCILQAAVDYAAQKQFIMPQFRELEQAWARENMGRAISAIQEELRNLDVLCQDWAAWDDTYAFAQDANPRYVQANLVDATFTDTDLDIIYVCDTTGKVIFGRANHPDTLTRTSLRRFPADRFPEDHPLLRGGRRGRSRGGVMLTEKGALLVTARAILPSSAHGPSRGTLIFGRFVTPGTVERWARQTSTSLRIRPLDKSLALDPLSRWAARNLESGRRPFITPHGKDHIHIYQSFASLEGGPALLLRVDIPAEISARGRYVGHYVIATALYRGVLILIAIVLLMRHIVITPGHALIRQMRRVREAGDLDLRIDSTRRDELGVLAMEFDEMLERLSQAQQELATRSRELQVAVSLLEQDIERRKETEERLMAYQSQLQTLAADLASTEDRERRELADILHDGVSQLVATAKMRVEALETGDTGLDLSDDLRQVSHLLEEAIREARSLTFELSPPVLRELGLEAAISWLLETPGYETLNCHLRDDGAPKPLDDDVAALVFKAVRELLTNVVKHARADSVTIDLSTDGSRVRVEVVDDGIGLSDESRAGETKTGFGLMSIRERIGLAGGSLDIISRPGEGVRAVLTAPIKKTRSETGDPPSDPRPAG